MPTTSKPINNLTTHIKIVGMGASDHRHRFVKILLKGSTSPVVVRYDNIASNRQAVFEWLNQQGAHLVDTTAQTELIKRIQAIGPRQSSFKVVEEIGLFGKSFILPDRVIPPLPQAVEKCLNDIPADIISKYKCAGTREGWRELARYAVGKARNHTFDNTRMMFAFALNFVGPVSAIWPRQSVAFQFTGDAGSGKSTVAVISTSIWGWDPNPSLGYKYGFGTSWNSTVNNLEAICKGYNHTILFLDETGVAERKQGDPVDNLDAVLQLDGQLEKGRKTAVGLRIVWSMPILSTSNVSVPQMAKARQVKEKNKKDPRVFCDRLIDIPPPRVGSGMFENLFEFQDKGEFSEHLKQLASENHGKAAREFIKCMLEKRAEDPCKLLDFLNTWAKEYKEKARTRIGSSEELVRIHDKFATVYAAGRLAIREKILPFWRIDFLEAILTCEQDHVRFVEDELAEVVRQQRNVIEILRAYIEENCSTFINLQKDKLPPNHDHANCPGYINEYDGHTEYLLSEKKLREIMGGKQAANELKKTLNGKGLIVTVGAGDGKMRYSTKRMIGRDRLPVVAIFADICENVIAPI